MTEPISNPLDDRVTASYSTHDDAKQAKAVLMRKLGLSDTSITLIEPNDTTPSRKLEGKSAPIGKKMLLLHLKYPAIGLLVGMIIAFLLVQFGPAFAQKSPMFTFIALISPGIFIGAFYAGFRSLKPEHDLVNQDVVESTEKNQWSLLIGTEQTDISKEEICEELKHTNYVNMT